MANLTFLTYFDLQATPKKFFFIDNTDYSGQGISTSDVNGCFTITSPSGVVIYNNTDFSNSGCDIYLGGFLPFLQQEIPLPLDANGMPELGTYTILYTVYDSNLDDYYTKTNTYNNTYVRPTIVITQSVDCLSPTFTSTDATNYTVSSLAPTTLTRTHTLMYPNGSAGQGSPTVSSAPVILRGAGQFYSGVQTTSISTDLVYDFADGLNVADTITDYQNFTVDCVDICNISCCLTDLETRLELYRTTNSALYKPTADLFAQVMGLVALIQLNISCGHGTTTDSMLETIKNLTNCTDGCSDCDTDENAPIFGLGTIINSIVVQSGGSPVVVTPVIADDVTTYVITLSSAFVSSVTSKYNTVVGIGAGSGSVTDSGVVGGIRTFTINTFTSASGITAHAGGGQGSATPLIKNKNRVDTVTTTNDSVKMPLAIAGNSLNWTEVINNAVNDLAVYPQTGETFLNYSANAPVIMVGGQKLVCYCFENGVWTF